MVKTISVGIMPTNSYIIYDENSKEALVIDPGDEAEEIVDFIEENSLTVKYIYLTHCHFDHILGAKWLKETLKSRLDLTEKKWRNLPKKLRRAGLIEKHIFGSL